MGYVGVNQLMTSDKAIDDQSDLYKLCRDRSLETKELFKPNSFYGIDYIIKKYSAIPPNKALKIIFPHGVSLSNNFVWKEEKNAIISCVYSYSPHRYKIYKNETNKVVLPAASPFVYLAELLNQQPNPEPEGTIFFPAHSTHHVTISVCIYWRDFNLGRHKIFKEKGFRIVSAGHMFDPWFLLRLYHLCSTHKYSASNELGSHLFYSVKSGCSFYFMNYKQTVKKATGSILERDVSIPDRKIVSNLLRLFSKPTEKPTDEQLRKVDSFLGVEHLKTPKELRKELQFADKLDKFGFSRHPESKKMYYRMPNLIPRKLLRNIKHYIENRFQNHST